MKIIEESNLRVALLDDEINALHDEQSVLDMIGELWFTKNISRLIICKETISDDFFNLTDG